MKVTEQAINSYVVELDKVFTERSNMIPKPLKHVNFN